MIAIGSDHAGFALKQQIVEHLRETGVEFKDFGCYNTESVHYTDYAAAVGNAVASGACEKGILICGTGIGISIAANKVKGVRAAHCHDTFCAKLTREHNDSNVLAMGGWVVGPQLAFEIVDIWLNTEFLGGRHQIRVDMLNKLDER